MFTITSVLRNGNTWTERVTEDAFLEAVQNYIHWYYKSAIKSFQINGVTINESYMEELQDEYEELVCA